MRQRYCSPLRNRKERNKIVSNYSNLFGSYLFGVFWFYTCVPLVKVMDFYQPRSCEIRILRYLLSHPSRWILIKYCILRLTVENLCFMNPCLNGGTCMEALGTHNCMCLEGFSGSACESKFFYCYKTCLNVIIKIKFKMLEISEFLQQCDVFTRE